MIVWLLIRVDSLTRQSKKALFLIWLFSYQQNRLPHDHRCFFLIHDPPRRFNPTQFSSNQRNFFSKYFHQWFWFVKLYFLSQYEQSTKHRRDTLGQIKRSRLGSWWRCYDKWKSFLLYQKRFRIPRLEMITKFALISLLVASLQFPRV